MAPNVSIALGPGFKKPLKKLQVGVLFKSKFSGTEILEFCLVQGCGAGSCVRFLCFAASVF